jgi:HEAT repeat protein
MTINSRRRTIGRMREMCLLILLSALVATTAFGQDQSDVRIAALNRDLKQGDYFVRWRAAKTLVRINPLSKEAVPGLMEALKIEEGEVCYRASEALVKIGPDAVPSVIQGLRHRDSNAYSLASGVLTQFGSAAVPALIDGLNDHNEDVRLGALIALGRVGPIPQAAFPMLLKLMKDRDPAIRSAAAYTIAVMGADAASAYPALLETLRDREAEIREAAASALSRCCGVYFNLRPGPNVQEAVAQLLAALKSRDANVRSGAASALAMMGQSRRSEFNGYETNVESPIKSLGAATKPLLDALIAAAKDPDETVRSKAIWALGVIDPTADAVVSTLLDAMKGSDNAVRGAAASALKSAPARAAIYPLILALQDREASVRSKAADALARPDAGFAVPRLIQLLGDRDEAVRNAAGRALEAIGHNAGRALVKASKDQDADIRDRAILILEKLDSNEALTLQIEALRNEDASVRKSAVSFLGGFAVGPQANTIASELIKALKDRDASVRTSAAHLLGAFAYNHTVASALIEALKDQDSHVRYTAAQSAIRVHGDPKPVIPILIAALKDQDPIVRHDAAATLGSLGYLGPDAKAAVPAILKLLDDRSLDVCKAAISALGNLGGQNQALATALSKLLKHWDRAIQLAAQQALSQIGAPATPLSINLLVDPDSTVRIRAYYSLVESADVETLIRALKRRDPDLRSLVFEALDEISDRSTSNAEGRGPVLDPSRKYLLSRGMTGCGFENEGRTMYVSELATGKNYPILASCVFLHAPTFLEFAGKYYSLIVEQGGGSAEGTSFWLYDMETNQFVIHAEGEITEKEPGVFSYAYYDGDETPTPLGTVTMRNLLNREKPLRVLGDYPIKMHGLTLRRNTRVLQTFSECFNDDSAPPKFEFIRRAGTKVMVISTCEDGSYEILYDGGRGNVSKGSLRLIK